MTKINWCRTLFAAQTNNFQEHLWIKTYKREHTVPSPSRWHPHHHPPCVAAEAPHWGLSCSLGTAGCSDRRPQSGQLPPTSGMRGGSPSNAPILGMPPFCTSLQNRTNKMNKYQTAMYNCSKNSLIRHIWRLWSRFICCVYTFTISKYWFIILEKHGNSMSSNQ